MKNLRTISLGLVAAGLAGLAGLAAVLAGCEGLDNPADRPTFWPKRKVGMVDVQRVYRECAELLDKRSNTPGDQSPLADAAGRGEDFSLPSPPGRPPPPGQPVPPADQPPPQANRLPIDIDGPPPPADIPANLRPPDKVPNADRGPLFRRRPNSPRSPADVDFAARLNQAVLDVARGAKMDVVLLRAGKEVTLVEVNRWVGPRDTLVAKPDSDLTGRVIEKMNADYEAAGHPAAPPAARPAGQSPPPAPPPTPPPGPGRGGGP